MKAKRMRPWLTWPVILLYLAALTGAVALVWAADGRQWYLDGAGIDARLDMAFTDVGRWLATAALGALAVLGLAALVFELASLRRGEGPASTERAAVLYAGRSAPYTPDGAPPRYGGVTVGADQTQRVERSLSVTPPAERVTSAPTGDDAPALRASLEQIQRQLDALRGRMDRSDAPPREHAAVQR